MVIYADANGDGQPDNFTPSTTTGSVAGGQEFRFVVAGTVPATQTDGTTAEVQVGAVGNSADLNNYTASTTAPTGTQAGAKGTANRPYYEGTNSGTSSANCTSGQVIGGFHGRYGWALDSLTFRCYSVQQAKLRLRAEVLTGSASTSSFTLNAVDSGVTSFTHNQRKIMTPGTYSIAPGAIPFGYTLTITRCVNDVNNLPVAVPANQLSFNLASDSEITCTLSFIAQSVIGGTIFEDITGNILSDGDTNLGDQSGDQRGKQGVRVCLYLETGVLAPSILAVPSGCTNTDATGQYAFAVPIPAAILSYWVVVRGSTITPANGGTGVAEQTYGPDGGLCVSATGSSGSPSFQNSQIRSSSGACYGGRRGATADQFSETLTSLSNAEHIARVFIPATLASVSGVDFGFSFNVVTNTNLSGQGSLWQFLTNANAIPGANAMRFVPAINTTSSGGGSTWWEINVTGTNPLPSIATGSGNNTTIDGRAYFATNGTDILNTNNASMGISQVVGRTTGEGAASGVTNFQISPVNGPELSLFTARSVAHLIAVDGNGFRLQNTALRGSSASDVRLNTVSDARISDNVFGSSSAAVFTAPTTNQSQYAISTYSSGQISNVFIERNAIIGTSSSGMYLNGSIGSPGLTITSNAIVDASHPNSTGDAIAFDSGGGSGELVIEKNLLRRPAGVGVEFYEATFSNFKVRNNTIESFGYLNVPSESFGVRVNSTAKGVIENNVFTSSSNASTSGVAIYDSRANGIRVSKNTFGPHGRNAIDLGVSDVNGATVNANACLNANGASSGNAGLARPTISRALLINNTLTLTGAYCGTGTYTLEFYKAQSVCSGPNTGDCGSDGLPAGEGVVYLGALAGVSGGTFTHVINNVNAYGFTVGDAVSVTASRTDGLAFGSTSEFSANSVLVSISGFVYEDSNGDGIKDNAEDWDGTTAPVKSLPNVYLKLTQRNGGACQADAIATLTVTPPTTGAYTLGASAADYCLLVDDNNTLTDITPNAPATWSFSPLGHNTIQISVTTSALTNLNFGLNQLRGILGKIFSDIGAGVFANNGVMNTNELGLSGVSVALTNCAATVYGTTTTDGSGIYSFQVPPAITSGVTLCVQDGAHALGYISTGASINLTALPNGSATIVAGSSYTYSRLTPADHIQFVFNGSSHADLNFGNVPANEFSTNSVKAGTAGSSMYHPHIFVAGTSGSVVFTVSPISQSPTAPWTQYIYRDSNCNQSFDTGDTLISAGSPLVVTAGGSYCLLVRQDIPQGITSGAQSVLDLTANFNFANAPSLPLDMRSLTVTTTVGASTLQLTKQVRNVTQSGGFGNSNQARSNDVVEYQISYTNLGAEPISNLLIADLTPPYTQFVQAGVGVLPTGISACQKTTPAGGPVACNAAQAAVGAGNISWSLVGTLAPGASGVVTFRVKVN